MTNFFDSEFDGIFKKMSSSFFNIDDVFEEFREMVLNPVHIITVIQ
jgi:hypothetical protein